MTDLDRLIAAVEAGDIARSDLDAFVPVLGLTTEANNALDAYRGSLDAALALKEALLPHWIWGRQKNGAMWVAKRPHTFVAPFMYPNSRALLLATLRAYAATQETKE